MAESGNGQAESENEQAQSKTENAPIDPDAVALKAGGIEISGAELFYYYHGAKRQLEELFSVQYGMDIDYSQMLQADMTFGDYLKYIVEVQVMNTAFLLSKGSEYRIDLTEDEIETVEDGAASFMETLTEENKVFYGFTEENVRTTLENSIMSSKILDRMLEEEKEAMTEEEKEDCRYRTVQHILFLYDAPAQTDESGAAVTPSESEAEEYKISQKAKAEEILARAQAGEDFETLAEEYNEDSGFEYSFNRNGQTIDGTSFVSQFVAVGNSLKEGEMAIAETEYGYHVMKCVSENDEALYEEALENAALNKLNEVYEAWLTEENPEFYDVWKNFIVQNPLTAAETDEK